MTDVMCCGYYPHDPVPGPREKTKHEKFAAWVETLDYRDYPVFLWPADKINPVLGPPMYFPGANWNADAVYA